jgi:hypothetical protein
MILALPEEISAIVVRVVIMPSPNTTERIHVILLACHPRVPLLGAVDLHEDGRTASSGIPNTATMPAVAGLQANVRAAAPALLAICHESFVEIAKVRLVRAAMPDTRSVFAEPSAMAEAIITATRSRRAPAPMTVRHQLPESIAVVRLEVAALSDRRSVHAVVPCEIPTATFRQI